MVVAYLSHPDCVAHNMGDRHPEQPARVGVIWERLERRGIGERLLRREAPLVTDEQLRTAHDPRYLAALEEASPEEGRVWLDGDTAMNPHSLQAAKRAAGAVVEAVDMVMGGEAQRAFCAVRPPGHHAERHRAMGFCLYGNVAIGALHAIEAHGLQRVAIVDFDVHHGNGTEDIVAGDERILFCSTFQHPFYPNSGHESTAANVLNVPLASGSGSAEFRSAVKEQWLPRLDEFAPELIIVSAGFDAHNDDGMASLELLDEDYEWVAEQLCDVARKSAEGRIVSALEGGYDLPSLARSVERQLEVFLR